MARTRAAAGASAAISAEETSAALTAKSRDRYQQLEGRVKKVGMTRASIAFHDDLTVDLLDQVEVDQHRGALFLRIFRLLFVIGQLQALSRSGPLVTIRALPWKRMQPARYGFSFRAGLR